MRSDDDRCGNELYERSYVNRRQISGAKLARCVAGAHGRGSDACLPGESLRAQAALWLVKVHTSTENLWTY